MEELLRQFDLSREEARVYTTLLRLGVAKISGIAEKIKIPRTSCQEYIRSLEEKGFVISSKVGNKFFYQVEDPDIFYQRVNERRFLVDRLIASMQEVEKEKEWKVHSLMLEEAEKKIQRAKKKNEKHVLFGETKSGGYILGDDRIVLYSEDKELSAIEMVSTVLVEFHADILK